MIRPFDTRLSTAEIRPWRQAAARARARSRRLALKSALSGEVNYSVLFASTGPMADNSLDSIKTALAENPCLRPITPRSRAGDRPGGAPQRANTQRVSGSRHDNGEPYEMAETRFTWCGQEIIFPRVPGSPSSGAIIATRDSTPRCAAEEARQRPKLAVVDDPDTEDTARSGEQADKLEKRIDAALGFLGGQQRSIGRVVLTTLQSRVAVSWRDRRETQADVFAASDFASSSSDRARKDHGPSTWPCGATT